MSKQITLELPDYLYARAKRLADLTQQDIGDILASQLGTTLPPLAIELDSTPVGRLSDDEIVLLANSTMDADLGLRLTALQDRQQAHALTVKEQAELQMLMELFEAGQLRKAEALVEAVKRGLQNPIQP